MRKTLASLLAVAALLCAQASDLNNPGIPGYLQRGRAMLDSRNYQGCIDQMSNAIQLGATGADLEEARWCMVLASLALDEDGAEASLQQWINDYPASPRRQEALMRAADVHFFTGEYAAALEAYARVDAAALTEPQRNQLDYRVAYSNLRLGHLDRAESIFADLVSSRADAATRNAATFYLGYIAYDRHNYDRALEMFKKVDITQAPGNAAPYYMAQIYYVKGDNANAYNYARNAIASGVSPSMTAESKRIAGEALYAMERRDEAVAYLWDYASTTTDPAPSAYYILGLSEWERGDYNAAGKLLQQAVKADDAMGQSAWLYLGQTFLHLDNPDAALMAFENASKMRYDDATRETAMYNYAVAKSQGGKAPFGHSAQLFEEFIQTYPKSRHRTDVERYIVTGYMSDGDYDGALNAIAKAKTLTPEMLEAKKRALFAKGTIALQSDDADTAADLLSQSLDVKPAIDDIDTQAQQWLGDANMRRGNYADAVQCYDNYLRTAKANTPNRALAQYNKGYALYQLKDYTNAASALTAALNTGIAEPRIAADARNRLGDIDSYAGRYQRAAANYAEAAALNPDAADYAMLQQAIMLGYTGNNKAKVSALDTLISRYPSSPYIADALLEKGATLSASGDMNAAAAAYTRLVEEYPQTAQGRKGALLLAIEARSAGNNNRAEAAYKHVIEAYPSSEEARIAADDLKAMMANNDRLDQYVAFMTSVPGAPEVNKDEIAATAFRVAEQHYQADGDTRRLEEYLEKYPNGAYQAETLYYLAQAADRRGLSTAAVAYASRLADAHPTATVTEDGMIILARNLIAQGRENEALEVYTTLEEKASNPSNLLTARMGRMIYDLRSGNDADVIATSDKILATSPLPTEAMVDTHFMRGVALSRQGKALGAEAEWAKVANRTGFDNGSKSAVYLAASMLERGDAKAAEDAINKFIDANPPQQYWLARAFIVLSDALRAQGRTFEADQYLKNLRDNYPGEQPDIFLMIDQRLK